MLQTEFDCINSGRVIVNGDDFGMSPGINTAIERLHQAGRLSSVSIMSNMPWSAAALAYACDATDLKSGVHLNLTTGRPLLSIDRVPSLVDRNGDFLTLSLLLRRLLSGRVLRNEIRRELQAQIDAARDTGLDIQHLDSHMHFHAVPVLGRLVTNLAHAYGVPAVRNPDFSAFVIPPPTEIGPVRSALQKAGTRVLVSTQKALAGRRIPLNETPPTARQLIYLRWCLEPGANPPAETFRSCICDLDGNNLEIIAHPAVVDDVLPSLTRYVQGRETELEFLASDAFGALLEEL